MSTNYPNLANPPIVEAVIDIDCELPSTVNLESLEAPAKECFGGEYPKPKTRHRFEHEFSLDGEPTQKSISKNIHSFMFLREDEKQLVQVRPQGFSFNRLEPYEGLSSYLAEIERTWFQFVAIANPKSVTSIRLRYINKIQIQFQDGRVELEEYLKLGPRLPDEERLTFGSFLNQYVAVEKTTGHEVKAILTSQKAEGDCLPIIFDITVASSESVAPNEWHEIRRVVDSLRDLKNSVFFNSLEDKCLELFQ